MLQWPQELYTPSRKHGNGLVRELNSPTPSGPRINLGPPEWEAGATLRVRPKDTHGSRTWKSLSLIQGHYSETTFDSVRASVAMQAPRRRRGNWQYRRIRSYTAHQPWHTTRKSRIHQVCKVLCRWHSISKTINDLPSNFCETNSNNKEIRIDLKKVNNLRFRRKNIVLLANY